MVDTDDTCPTLTFNTIGRHQSRLVRTRVASTLSLALHERWAIYTVPISMARAGSSPRTSCRPLAANGQIATQYVDEDRRHGDGHFCQSQRLRLRSRAFCPPTAGCSGKMGHAERIGSGLYKNVPGEYDMELFRSAVEYF
ncbi:MAG: phosphoribosylformylglycinamidine synthase subunit PurQ [Oscillospiraceae bacterium]